MAFITDYELLNNAATSGNWTASGFDSPTLNDSSATTPIYLEGSACMWWPLKKGTTNGSVYTSTITGTPSFANRVVVGLLNYPFADIDLIPITLIRIRVASNTGFTTYYEWDAVAQLLAPYNTPISGHTPIIVYAANPDGSSGTYSANIESVGWVATTGNDADGKQGGFDFFFVVGWVGWHSGTLTDTFFSSIAAECYDSDGGGLPGTNGRPIPIFSQSGNFFQTNVSIQFGDGSSDTANNVISETGKTVFFSNIEPEQELGYIFVDPNSTHENRVTLTDCVHFWSSQQSTHEIFTDPENATYFKITGCSFSDGGIFESPPDSANRWIRNCKFSNCQTGVISDGEFTDNIVSSCYAVTVTGDADLTGTQFLTPAVAADGAALIWNGAYDPDGNIDDTTFTKGTNAHHAIEFGIASPLNMTLRNIDFLDFTNTIGSSAAPIHVKRTSGTVTITLDGCSGITADGYKSAGATVSILVGAVTVQATITDATGAKIENARVFVMASDGAGPFPFEDTVTIVNSGTTATVTHTAHGMASNDYVYIDGGSLSANKGVFQITYISTSSYSYTMASTPGASPTGTITSTFVALYGLTNASGVVSFSRVYSANQNVAGWARKSSSSPYFKEGPISGTVNSSTGASLNGVLVSDE